jgi:hypothetical protein
MPPNPADLDPGRRIVIQRIYGGTSKIKKN